MAESLPEPVQNLSLEDVEPIQVQGGYPLEIFQTDGNKIDKNLICSICNLVFRDPMQRECGHRFCQVCLENADMHTTCTHCLAESDEGTNLPTVSMLNPKVNCSPDYFLRKELDRLPAQCIYPQCNWKGKFRTYKQHCLNCDWLPLECSRCHTKDIPCKLLEIHRKDACSEMIPCPLDCGSQIPQKMVSEHLQQDLCGHLLKLKSLVNSAMNSGDNNHYPTELMEKLSKMDRMLGVFQADMVKFTQLLVNEIKERETLAIKVTKMMPESYNGILVWRVDDFEKRRQDAISGTCTSIYSSPFYTNNFGYKMCLRLYLNGDGIGKGKTISLFIVVMQGQYDAVLMWPFKQKVTLMMLDQVESKHIIDTFRPDSKSSSFQRPENKMNIASGCPLFFQIEKLNNPNNYVRNNTAFFKVIVDQTGLEKMPINFMPS